MDQLKVHAVIDGLIKNSILFTDEVISEMQLTGPCSEKGEPHFIRINPSIANPLGDRIPCPVCNG